MSLIDLSGNLLFAAFIAYLVATLLIGGSIKSQKPDGAEKRANKWGQLAIIVTIIGFLAHIRLLYYTLDLFRTCTCK